MANAFVAMCYATAKKAGVDTSKMSPDDVIEWYNKQQGKKEAKEKTKEIIKNYVANNQQKEEKKETQDDAKNEFFVKKIDRNNNNELESSINKINSWLLKKEEEHAVIIDKNGNVFENKGEDTWVNLPGNVDYEGSIIMHNHTNSHSFGKDDLMCMQQLRNSEFRLVDKDYIYKAKFKKELDMSYNSLYLTALDKAYEIGDVSQTDDIIMQHLKEGGYIEYEKSKRNS